MNPTDKYRSYVGYWVKRTFMVSSNKVNDALRPYDLARSQWEVLFYIYHNKSVSQKKLQAVLQVESATLTGIVDVLVKKKWIMRSEDATDRRSKTLTLTKVGLKRWKEIPDPIDLVSKQMMKGVAKEEEAVVIRVLQKMLNNLES